ncbi:MAG: DUF4258 domain-containing protein [Gammaproteobacteria bacterium]|nr:DUF4258 domain-containing protein [Gammaproteobacteria bacterium]
MISDKPIEWDEEKNKKLQNERGISFEAIVTAIETGCFIKILNHPKLKHQKILEVELDGYIVHVPYVEDETKRFFKAAYHNRKATKNLSKGSKNEH